MDFRTRQKKVQQELGRHNLDALLITHLPNIRYLCGFTGSSGVLVVSEARSVFFTDGRYTEQAQEQVTRSRIVVARQGPLSAAAEWILANQRKIARKKKGAAAIGIEGEHLTVSARSRVAKALGSTFRLTEAPPLVERARMIKDADEIKLIRDSARLGSDLFASILKTVKPGVRETEVAAELEHAARRAGAEQMSFQTIIASGKRSALPHGVASTAKIPARGFVVCDFGVILAGYCSDMTRTLHVGSPGAGARKIYQIVRDAQRAAIACVKAGVSLGEVDGAARNLLKKRDLSKYFTHSTGHGVGLEIHESPRIAAGQADVLQSGMVITIEPGVYIPQRFGIRIEDMVLVTESGCEVLTPASKELINL